MVTTAPVAPQPPVAPPVTSPKPGWQTTEFWLSLVVTLISLLYGSGVVGPGTKLDHALGFILAVLSQLGYVAVRGQTKAAHAAAANDNAPVPTPKLMGAALVAGFALLTGVGISSQSGCNHVTAPGGGSGSATVGSGSGSGSGFLACAGQDVGQLVDPSNPNSLTILATVIQDLAQKNFADLITQLIAKVGEPLVACAVDWAFEAAQHASGPSVVGTNAAAVIDAHGWHFSGSSK